VALLIDQCGLATAQKHLGHASCQTTTEYNRQTVEKRLVETAEILENCYMT